MAVNAFVVADNQGIRIDEADAGALSEVGLEEGRQKGEHLGHQLHKSAVADQTGEIVLVFVAEHEIVVLEGSVVRAVESDDDGHDFTVAEAAGTMSFFLSGGQQSPEPKGLEELTEVVDTAKQFGEIYGCSPGNVNCWQTHVRESTLVTATVRIPTKP